MTNHSHSYLKIRRICHQPFQFTSSTAETEINQIADVLALSQRIEKRPANRMRPDKEIIPELNLQRLADHPLGSLGDSIPI